MCARQKKKIKRQDADYQKLVAQLPTYEGFLLQGSTFNQIFACIYSDVVDYTWYLLDNLWGWGNPDGRHGEEIRSQSLFSNDIQITDSDVLLQYASAASNDWCTIYGVCSPSGIETFAEKITQKIYDSKSVMEKFDFHANAIDTCIFNVDGAYWGVFSRHDCINKRLTSCFAEAKRVPLTDLLFAF